MSAQRLGDKKTRWLARTTGLDIVRAWSFGGYGYAFVTADHQHGGYDLKTGEWEIDADPVHFQTCSTPEKFAAEYGARS